MKKILNLSNLYLFTIFCMPLYLVHVVILSVPTNLFELLVLISLLFFLFYKKTSLFSYLSTIPTAALIGTFLLILGIILSILFSDTEKLTGFGILKSWFLLPMFFSYALYGSLLEKKISVENIFFSMYCSTLLVAVMSLGYKVLGLVTYDNRLQAFYQSPNYLAMYLAIGIFLGGYFIQKEYPIKKYSKYFWFYLTNTLLISLTIYFTYSYAAWLAIALSLLFLLLIIRPKKIFVISTTLLLLLALIFFLQINTPKFQDFYHFSDRSSMSSRLMIWEVAIILIKKNPILGIGPGNFQSSYLSLQLLFPPYLEWAVPQPHNVFLAFWLESGIVGLSGFLLLLFWIFSTTLKMLLGDKKNTVFTAPLFGFFVYTILHGLVDTTHWKNDLSFLFWIFITILIFINNNFLKKSI